MKQPKITLYNLEACPYCAMVRRKLADLGLAYEKIEVPALHELRTEVVKVSGQPMVPVMVDGEVVLDDEDKIVAYLETTYGTREGTG